MLRSTGLSALLVTICPLCHLLSGAESLVPRDYGTIQEAIDAAVSGDAVVVAPGTYEVTRPIVFRGKAITLRSEGGPEVTVIRMATPEDPERASVFRFEDGEPAGTVLEGFTITGGRGSAAQIPGLGSTRYMAGGAIYCGSHSELHLRGNIVRENTATFGGGIFCAVDSLVRLTGNSILANTPGIEPQAEPVGGGGGLACMPDSRVLIEDDLIAENRAEEGGGILVAPAVKLEAVGLRLERNSAATDGGGLLLAGGELSITSSFLRSNEAASTGGGISIKPEGTSMRFELRSTRIESNRARRGGGMFIRLCDVTTQEESVVDDCQFSANQATMAGGACVFDVFTISVPLTNCRFERNVAKGGGALFYGYDTEVQVENSYFFANRASFGGVAFGEMESRAAFTDCTLIGNSAIRSGGAIYMSDSTAHLTHCTLVGNTAAMGGAFFGMPFLDSSIVWRNPGGSLGSELPHDAVEFSLIDTDAPLEGTDNIRSDPLFAGWTTGEEIVIEECPRESSAGEAPPCARLEDALSGYSLALTTGSPCIGAGRDGTNMGAPNGVVESEPVSERLVVLGPGSHVLRACSLTPNVSLLGSDPRQVEVQGTIVGLSSGATLANVTVTGGEVGGIIVSRGEAPLITNCLITGNRSDHLGSGISCVSSSPTLRNCTITGNTSPGGGALWAAGTASPVLVGCILWHNSGGSVHVDPDASVDISYSCLETTPVWPGEGNISQAPRFEGWVAGSDVYVDSANPDEGEGTSGHPFRSLSAALRGYSLALCSTSPCLNSGQDGNHIGALTGLAETEISQPARTVHIAAGRYSVSGAQLTHRVSLLGAGQERTVLLGTLVGLRSGARITSLTVTEGSMGGVVISSGESPELEACSIVANSNEAIEYDFELFENANGSVGGGVTCYPGSSPALTACEILDNEDRGWLGRGGGGLYSLGASPRLTDCAFRGNRGRRGGGGALLEGASSPHILGCRFASNVARYGGGGGVACVDGADAMIMFSSVVGNRGDLGGGLYVGGASPTIESCVIQANRGEHGGGVACTQDARPGFSNCLIAGNHSPGTGGGVYVGIAEPRFLNCTVASNQAEDGSGGVYCHRGGMPAFINCIVRRNHPDSLCGQLSGNLMDVDPGFEREGVYDFSRFDPAGAPEFIVDPGDYELAADSPAIDAALEAVAPAVDIVGKTRPCGKGPDLGAYEHCGEPLPPQPFRRGDADASGSWDLTDALYILGHLFLGGPPPPCRKAADSDDSGRLDLNDGVFLLRYLFLGNSAPRAPFPECGFDPTEDDLSCHRSPACEG